MCAFCCTLSLTMLLLAAAGLQVRTWPRSCSKFNILDRKRTNSVVHLNVFRSTATTGKDLSMSHVYLYCTYCCNALVSGPCRLAARDTAEGTTSRVPQQPTRQYQRLSTTVGNTYNGINQAPMYSSFLLPTHLFCPRPTTTTTTTTTRSSSSSFSFSIII